MIQFPDHLNLTLESDCVDILTKTMQELYPNQQRKAHATLHNLIRFHGKLVSLLEQCDEGVLNSQDLILLAVSDFTRKVK